VENTDNFKDMNIEEEIFRSIFNNAGFAVALVDLDGNLILVNNFFKELLGYELDDQMKSRIFDFVYPDDMGEAEKLFKELTSGIVSSYTKNHRYLKQNGDVFWGHLTAIAIKNNEGNTEYTVELIKDITEQRQIEMKFEREQRLLKALMDNLSDSIYFKDLNSYFINLNKASAKKMGYDNPDELVGKSDHDIFSKEHAEKALKDEQDIISSGKPKEGIVEKEIWQDGSYTWASTTKMPLRDESNRIIGTFGITRDITEERNALLKLKYQAKLLNDLNDALVAVDNEYKITSWNKGAEQMYGVVTADALGQDISKLLVAKMPDEDRQEIRRIVVTNGSWRGEAIHFDKNKNEIDVDWSINAVHDSEGKLIGNVAIIRDITERNKMVAELTRSEERFRALYENATIGLYRSSPDGKIELANPALLRMFGYSTLEEFLGVDIAKDGYEKGETRDEFLKQLNRNEEIRGFENTWKTKNGKIISIRESAKLIKDKKGKPLYIEGTVEDISERVLAEEKIKKYNEELKILNANKDKFFSIIAHDLRSPFTALLGYSDLIVNEFDEMESDEIKQFVKYINDEAKNVYGLLDNLLAWSRIQRGQFAYSPSDFSISSTIEKAITLFKDTAKNKNVELTTAVTNNISVFADENSFFTALRNLISNAIKFTPDGGKITIDASVNDNFVEVSVEDTGVGINETDIKKLFKPDVHHTTIGTSNEKGTGLGLLLCKELIEKNDGEISVSSEVGKGTKFTLKLPAD
jgi:PAS domain S-box-containing protein